MRGVSWKMFAINLQLFLLRQREKRKENKRKKEGKKRREQCAADKMSGLAQDDKSRTLDAIMARLSGQQQQEKLGACKKCGYGSLALCCVVCCVYEGSLLSFGVWSSFSESHLPLFFFFFFPHTCLQLATWHSNVEITCRLGHRAKCTLMSPQPPAIPTRKTKRLIDLVVAPMTSQFACANV